MSLDLVDAIEDWQRSERSLEKSEQANRDNLHLLWEDEQILAKKRQEKIHGYQMAAENANKTTKFVKKQLENELDCNKNKREKEMEQIKFEEKQRQENHWVDMERLQSHQRKSSELRQQYMDRDSARDKDEINYKTHEYKKAIEAARSYNNSVTENQIKWDSHRNHNRLTEIDAETRNNKALGDVERMRNQNAVEARKMCEAIKEGNESAERTTNRAIYRLRYL